MLNPNSKPLFVKPPNMCFPSDKPPKNVTIFNRLHFGSLNAIRLNVWKNLSFFVAANFHSRLQLSLHLFCKASNLLFSLGNYLIFHFGLVWKKGESVVSCSMTCHRNRYYWFQFRYSSHLACFLWCAKSFVLPWKSFFFVREEERACHSMLHDMLSAPIF